MAKSLVIANSQEIGFHIQFQIHKIRKTRYFLSSGYELH